MAVFLYIFPGTIYFHYFISGHTVNIFNNLLSPSILGCYATWFPISLFQIFNLCCVCTNIKKITDVLMLVVVAWNKSFLDHYTHNSKVFTSVWVFQFHFRIVTRCVSVTLIGQLLAMLSSEGCLRTTEKLLAFLLRKTGTRNTSLVIISLTVFFYTEFPSTPRETLLNWSTPSISNY